MIEKVNPMHPDKVADRIAGAIVDIAYASEENSKIAAEVLIGHGVCHAIIETSAHLDEKNVADAIYRIDGTVLINRDIFDTYLERFHEPATGKGREEMMDER